MTTIQQCEVCGSSELLHVLNLGNHPLCDDLIPIGNPNHCETYPIEILLCNRCHTAHQRYNVPKVTLFPKTYHYRSRFTADVLTGMSDLVQSIEERIGSLTGKVVLDIGCNDGSLLNIFASRGAKTIGIEPTAAFADAEASGHTVINEFFTESTAQHPDLKNNKPDVITFTNVFAHIEDLPSLLKSLSVLLKDETIVVIENHYLGAVLNRNQFDTFYHEHPRTYSLKSFIHIANSLQRSITHVEFPSRYGGNIRVCIGNTNNQPHKAAENLDALIKAEQPFPSLFAQMNSFLNLWKETKSRRLRALIKEHGPLRAKAFPGRSAILVKLLNLTEQEIECVYEKPGSLKIGNYVPGTRIPIKSDVDLFETINKQRAILNLAWHIPTEIETYLRENGYEGHIENIL